MTDDTDSHIA